MKDVLPDLWSSYYPWCSTAMGRISSMEG